MFHFFALAEVMEQFGIQTGDMKHFIKKKCKAAILRHTSIRRFARMEEVVGTVLCLACGMVNFVSSSLVTVDGELTAITFRGTR